MSAAADYFKETSELLERLGKTQTANVERAAEVCANSIANGGLVFLFGAGHRSGPRPRRFSTHVDPFRASLRHGNPFPHGILRAREPPPIGERIRGAVQNADDHAAAAQTAAACWWWR